MIGKLNKNRPKANMLVDRDIQSEEPKIRMRTIYKENYSLILFLTFFLLLVYLIIIILNRTKGFL